MIFQLYTQSPWTFWAHHPPSHVTKKVKKAIWVGQEAQEGICEKVIQLWTLYTNDFLALHPTPMDVLDPSSIQPCHQKAKKAKWVGQEAQEDSSQDGTRLCDILAHVFPTSQAMHVHYLALHPSRHVIKKTEKPSWAGQEGQESLCQEVAQLWSFFTNAFTASLTTHMDCLGPSSIQQCHQEGQEGNLHWLRSPRTQLLRSLAPL